jgi:hypothetical protein|tara:strand:- start:3887 stop:4297 length:411 start_codon:yes stop_codon:yes gene_type:complete
MGAEKGNRYAEKNTLEEWEKLFNEIYTKATKGKYNSLQDAWISNDVRQSTATWLCDKYKVLASIKKDIASAIIREINDQGLRGNYNPAMCIWRNKQLGEKDTQYQEVNQNNKTIELTDEEKDARFKELMKKAKGAN